MNTKQEIYVDGVNQIHFAGNMVRLDFMTIQPESEDKVNNEINLRVIMNPQGFLDTFNNMQKLIDKLMEAGLISKQTNTAISESTNNSQNNN